LFAGSAQTNSLVTLTQLAPQLLIPGAVSSPGANGTFFRSDITIVNFAHSDQRLQLRWLPQKGGTASLTEMTIRARETIRSDDFVKTYLGSEGLGALLITAVSVDGSLDPNAKLFATSRVWTPVPGREGTMSQGMDAIPPSTINLGGGAIFGSLRDAQHRVNLAIVNLDSATQIFVVNVRKHFEVYSFVIPPFSMDQITLNRSSEPIEYVTVGGKPGSWFAYTSSIDNLTGSAWTEYVTEVVP
jgi:hypothetical protein